MLSNLTEDMSAVTLLTSRHSPVSFSLSLTHTHTFPVRQKDERGLASSLVQRTSTEDGCSVWHPDELVAHEGLQDGPWLLLMSSTASRGMLAMAPLLFGERPPVQNDLCEKGEAARLETGNCAPKRQMHGSVWAPD